MTKNETESNYSTLTNMVKPINIIQDTIKILGYK